MCRVPKTTSRFTDLLGGLNRTQLWVTAKAYKAQSALEKMHGAGWRKQSSKPRVLSQRCHTGHAQFFQQQIVATHVKCLSGKLTGDSGPRVFIGIQSHRHCLWTVYQNSRLLEGKQVFSLNQMVCTSSLGSEPLLSALGVVRTLLKSEFPDTSQGPPCKQT